MPADIKRQIAFRVPMVPRGWLQVFANGNNIVIRFCDPQGDDTPETTLTREEFANLMNVE